MKGRLLVVFHSNHGYVKRYVDIIGNAFGCDAVPANKLQARMLADYDKILYIGSMRGGEINGFKKFSDYLEGVYKKLVVCGVGLMPYRNYLPHRIKENSVSVMYEKFIPVFYAQGGFDVDELSRTEKFAINWRVRQIKVASVLSDDDTFLMNAISTPVDEVKKENIQPLLDYLDDKPVDEKLYSPPEITDPEEEKIFFEELEKASKSSANTKRELKKKLKKKSFGKYDAADNDTPDTENKSAAETETADAETKEHDAASSENADIEPTADEKTDAEATADTAEPDNTVADAKTPNGAEEAK